MAFPILKCNKKVLDTMCGVHTKPYVNYFVPT